MLHQRKAEIIAKVNQLVQRGNEMFGITLPELNIRFDLRGRAAGQACRRGNHFYLRFNTDMMTREAWDHIINNTVPHEVAHSFCQFQPRLGKNHDAGWARVCRQLGGNGERCHSEEVVYGKGHTYEYTTDRGHKVRVGDKYHAMVQRGQILSYRKGLGKITRECQYIIVGYAGRSLAAPVVQTLAVVPATREVPVQNIIPTAPAVPAATAPATFAAGASKASVSRSIMLAGYNRGETYESIIAAMMAACGYDRQLARATYKANYLKVGCPAP